ncbi:P-loop containing nucleoside triphosphate hydrolase protein [Suillus paluster]|uniref:P-loop containing nucleoside triphosphate hydrolase protein n=1 Tax=Suillus paluster TaxID=48578 RepID=UPI001B86AB50|nr:P-loop containing nucleoside triphosphate hydrolase protein [Suillus paluster]KAG1728187.1 P-loop containing nucleoside triphosphate hydrolase protein [Suillus paluster]
MLDLFSKDQIVNEAGLRAALHHLDAISTSGATGLQATIKNLLSSPHVFAYIISVWDRSERMISQILTDFPTKSQEYPSSLASKILDNLSICFLALPVESLETEVLRDISRHRGFIEGTLPLLRALSTMKFSSANSFEDESDLFDIEPDEGFVKMKVHQKMRKRHRQKPQHAGINTSLFARLDVAVPTTSDAATALSTHILAELKQVLSLYLSLLRWTELADDIKALLFPNVEESAKDLYPMVQPMKAALYFDNADGFGEWRILVSTEAYNNLRECRRADREIFKNIFKTIRHLSRGHFSSDNQKRLDGTDAGILVFEAKLTKDLRLVVDYQIDCIPDQDGESERQVIKVYGIYKHSELGRIWNALGNHLARKGAEYRRQCIFRTKAANNVILPASFPPAEPEPEIPASPLDLSAKDMDDVESSRLAGPREIRNVLAGFFCIVSSQTKTYTTPSCSQWKVVECTTSCYVLGRSGTGKTTTMLYKILGIQRAWESSGIDMPKPHQIFVTKSRTLATKVGEDFTRLLKSLTSAGSTLQELAKLKAQSILNDLVDHDDAPESQMNIPMRYSQLEDKHFPLFVTFDQLAKMIAVDVFDMDDPKTRRSAELFFTTDDAETHDSLVTYNVFKNQYWPHFPQGLTKNLSSAASFAIHGWVSASFWASTNLYPIKQLLNPHIGIIKGSEQALSCPDGVLDRSSYIRISRRSNPISANHMDSVYDIFEIYKKFKKYKYHLDVADRMHAILKVLGDQRFPGRQIDYLYVDEVQDNLLINALDRLFWAADTVQVISAGSSFRFDNLKVFIYCVERQSILVNSARAPVHQPTMFQLGMNYRSHGGTVNCAHSVIELITKFWPDSIDHLQPEKGMVDGVKPIFFTGPDDDTHYKQFLVGERDKLGPNQCILVRNDAACQKLREQVGDIGIIMTLYESKGLEFDNVLLYGFFKDSIIDASQWQVILNGVDSQGYTPNFYCDKTRYAGICSELKHLYVGITQARKNMQIFDRSDKSDAMCIFWTSRNLIQNCAHDSDIPPLVVSFDPEEWASSGRSLFLHKIYSQALHCFQCVGCLCKVKVCKAYLLRETVRSSVGVALPNVQQKAFIMAADAFADCGTAATGNEKCQYYHTSAACYVRGGEDLKAADIYLAAQEFGLAVKRYCKAGSFDRMLRVLTDYRTIIPEETTTALWTACRLYYCRKSNNQAPLPLFSSSDEELEFLEAYGLDYARVSLLKSHSRYYEVAELHLSENRPMEAAQAFLEDNRNADSAACAADALLESLRCKYLFRITRAAVPDDSVQHSIALTNQLQMCKDTIIPNPLIVLPPPAIAPFAPSQPPIIMSNASKGINVMPGANSTRALSFNGKTSELLEFFELFKDLVMACALTDAEKCKLIVHYVNLQTKRFWVTLIGYESKNFTAFKDSILAQYSGVAKGQ